MHFWCFFLVSRWYLKYLTNKKKIKLKIKTTLFLYMIETIKLNFSSIINYVTQIDTAESIFMITK